MPTPLNNPNPLARIQPAQVTLPSLEKMRADLGELADDKQQPPIVRILAGSQRFIVDHMIANNQGQRGFVRSVESAIDVKFRGIIAQLNQMLSPPAEAEPAQEAEPEPVTEEPAPVEPQQAPAAPPAPEKTAPPQMTVTPKPRTRRQNNGGVQ